jgi:hypothetical protein
MNPNKIKRSALGVLCGVAFFLIFLGYEHYEKQNSPNQDDAKLNELQRISSETPIPTTFRGIDSRSSSRSINAGVYNTYYSLSKYEEIKQFYLDELTPKGWQLLKDEDLRSWLSSSYHQQRLTFRKQDLLIIIEYMNGVKPEYQWNYAVNFVWQNRNWPMQ